MSQKDPAFLFYSKDFYEGTRLMLPEERACYIDLMIYQHQHGYIPNDIKRMLMYCSGVNEATLEATLEAKFKLTDKGWLNSKLNNVINERREYAEKQSSNGLLGQFFKKAKSNVSIKIFNKLKDYIYNEYGKENLIEQLKKDKTTHEAMLKALLKHLEDVNENEDVIKNKDKEIINSEVKNEILNSQSWIEQICIKKKITLAVCTEYLKEFIDDAELKGELNNLEDSKRHFVNWLNIRLKEKKEVKKVWGINDY